MVGETHHHALGEYAADRVDGLGARLFVEDVEDFLDGAAERILLRPAGQTLGDWIDPRDAGILVSGQHAVADAVEGGPQAFLAAPHGLLRLAERLGGLPLLGHVAKDQYRAARGPFGVA